MKIVTDNNTIERYGNFFVGRQDQIEVFWQKYNELCECKDEWPVTIFNYHGVGGVGKTYLINKIYNEIKQRNIFMKEITPTTFLRLNNSDKNIDILISIVKQLHDEYRYSFPLFETLLGLGIKNNINIETDYKTLEERSPIISALLDISGIIPRLSIVGVVIKCIDKGIKQLSDYVLENKEFIDSWDGYSIDQIESLLPRVFVQDLKYNIAQNIYPAVFFFDKYENFRSGNTGEDVIDYQIEWLKKDIISNVSNCIWVFSSREKINWENDIWEDSIINVEISFFSESETEEYLKKIEISNKLVQELYEITSGLPLYLYLCQEILVKQKKNGKYNLEILHGKQERLLHTYIENLNDIQKQILFIMATLGEWDDSLLESILEKKGMNGCIKDVQVMLKKSYTYISEGRYILHQVIQEKVFQYCSYDEVKEIKDVLNDSVDKNKFTWKYLAFVRCTIKCINDEKQFNEILKHDLSLIVELLDNNNINYFELCYKEIEKNINDSIRNSYQFMILKIAHIQNMVDMGYFNYAKKEINAMIRRCKGMSYEDIVVIHLMELKARILDNKNKFIYAYNTRKKITEKAEKYDMSVQISCKHNLITSYINLRKYDEAERELKYVINYREKHLDTKKEKEDYIRALLLNARIYEEKFKTGYDMGQIKKAIQIKNNCYNKALHLLKGDDSFRAYILNQLGDLYMVIDDWGKSIINLEKSKQIYMELNGGRNIITDRIERSIAICLIELGKDAEGIRKLDLLGDFSLDYKEGGNLVKYKNALEKSISFSKRGKHKEAYDIINKIIPECVEVLGKRHLTTMKLLYQKAVECRYFGDYLEALDLLKEINDEIKYFDNQEMFLMHIKLLTVECKEGLCGKL